MFFAGDPALPAAIDSFCFDRRAFLRGTGAAVSTAVFFILPPPPPRARDSAFFVCSLSSSSLLVPFSTGPAFTTDRCGSHTPGTATLHAGRCLGTNSYYCATKINRLAFFRGANQTQLVSHHCPGRRLSPKIGHIPPRYTPPPSRSSFNPKPCDPQTITIVDYFLFSQIC